MRRLEIKPTNLAYWDNAPPTELPSQDTAIIIIFPQCQLARKFLVMRKDSEWANPSGYFIN